MMFCVQRQNFSRDFPRFFPRFFVAMQRTGALSRLLMCSVLFLMFTAISGKVAAAESEGSTVGKHRPATAGAKNRKRSSRKKSAPEGRGAAKAKGQAAVPKKAARASSHSRPRVQKGAAVRKAVPSSSAARQAVTPEGVERPSAKGAAPELLPRCGFTEASRRHLFSRAVYVLDEQTDTPLYSRNADLVAPIASVTKLMTAIVWLDQSPPAMGSRLEVTDDDLDTLKFTNSRLAVGSSVTRADMLHIALMSSENRAAAALSRDYPGGRAAFIAAMNAKAAGLAMPHTHFVNATGLAPENVSTAKELADLVKAANHYQLIRSYSVDKKKLVNIGRGQLQYINSNRLIRYGQVNASVQKTGFINEAGHNMVFRMMVHNRRPVIVSLLGSDTGDGSRLDGVRIAKWLTCSLQ
ncbi:MAG: D-alanyl-D-alanine endopeptidase [Herbaspirillum frisingense]|uniref:D-alanyl-D-alanine endopeptidase n=1 Tax=Herbaspirillum frisingense TaxID=92645 RepID=A0A7V8FWX2_9BURK|nr:MAG: D-alanyl-D-alanine endopeptidase [Herbaspirillum frisingense]